MKSTEQVAELFGISSNHVRLLATTLQPQPEKVGKRSWVWTDEDIERLRTLLASKQTRGMPRGGRKQRRTKQMHKVIVKSTQFKAECDRKIAAFQQAIAVTAARDDLSEAVKNSVISDHQREIRYLEDAKQDEIIDGPDDDYEFDEDED